MAVNTPIPTPPRLTGDPAADIEAFHTYLHTLHTAIVVESKLVDPQFQGTSAVTTFDPANPPTPDKSSIGIATAMAAQALKKAYGLI